jgi:phage tail-like protein
MPAVVRDDPYPGYNFRVTLTGIAEDGAVALFSEVSNIEAELGVIEYRGGAEPATPRKLPGIHKFANVTMKRGITGHIAFWNWILEGMNGKVHRTDGSIVLMDENQQDVMRWNIRRAWPAKYTGPGLNAANNEVAIETLEIAHEGLSIDGQAG